MPYGSIWINYTRNYRLTGKIRFVEKKRRFSCARFLSVEVEQEWEQVQLSAPPPINGIPEEKWRRQARWLPAEPIDMADPALRWVIDGKAA